MEQLYKSGEDYLEAIYILEERTKSVRAVDVATELGYSKASISRAMGILKSNGYITVNDEGKIKLTESGVEQAKRIYERHLILKRFFKEFLGVDETTADKDACNVEHVLSDKSFFCLKEFLRKIEISDKII